MSGEKAFEQQALSSAQEKKIYIIHEHSPWLEPLRQALEKHNYPYEEWFVNQGTFDVQAPPPDGIFYNRMSASSHTRDHRYAVELTEPVLAWLEAYGRKVINDRRAILLETRKIEQYITLNRFGIKTPYTVAAVGREQLIAAARKLDKRPFIVKPNRGGKGTGVKLYESVDELIANIENYQSFTSLDGINLVQEFIKSNDQTVHRLEFIGGKFYYATQVDASRGFELCPADPCAEGEEPLADTRFKLLENYTNPELLKYERFLAANGMHVAAIEYIEDALGERYVYDVNINTNYNAAAEASAASGKNGMEAIARYLGRELEKLNARDALIAEEEAYAKTLFTA